MNETARKSIAEFDVTSPIGAGGGTNPVKNSDLQPKKISEKLRETLRGDSKDSDKDFQRRVNAFTPVCVKLLGFLDAGGEKFIRVAGREIAEEDQLDKIVESVKLGETSAQSGGEALARIIARRVQNEELLDYLIIGTVLVEWGAGITIAVAELKRIQKQGKAVATA